MTDETADRMLGKSFLDDVEVRRLSTGAYALRSAKTPDGLCYLATPDRCSCRGFHYHGYCKHIARVRFEEAERAENEAAAR
jgi:hypothetical protein